MGFQDDLQQHIEKVRERVQHIKGEEATKQALVIPLLQVLGWDVFHPKEVKPEYTADFAVKKSGQFEKVDYAICIDDKPVIFMECKALGSKLESKNGQLARYFNSSPDVKFGIISDGIHLHVYSDFENVNVMDSAPWLSLDLLNLKSKDIEFLERFCKKGFSINKILSLGEDLLRAGKITGWFREQIEKPSEAFVKFVLDQNSVSGRLTAKTLERLTPVVERAWRHAISLEIKKQIKEQEAVKVKKEKKEKTKTKAEENESIVTQDEVETFNLINGWVQEIYPSVTLQYGDYPSYSIIYMESYTRWFVSFWVQAKPFWINFKRLTVQEIKLLASEFEVSSNADSIKSTDQIISTVKINSLLDLPKLKEAFLLAFEREFVLKFDVEDEVTIQNG